jgi:hypothetical protein
MGARPETQLLASGFVLGASVLYDALLVRSAAARKGKRPELMLDDSPGTEGTG